MAEEEIPEPLDIPKPSYTKEDKDRVIDMVLKMREYCNVMGHDLEKLLIKNGRFNVIPDAEDIMENKNNMAQQLEGVLRLILRNIMVKT